MKPKTSKASGSQTTAPITAPIGAFKPEFVRLPKPGLQEPYCGLARSKLNELILPTAANKFKPPVKSICLRQRGAKRGIRLIVFDSLMTYLRGLAEQGEAV